MKDKFTFLFMFILSITGNVTLLSLMLYALNNVYRESKFGLFALFLVCILAFVLVVAGSVLTLTKKEKEKKSDT